MRLLIAAGGTGGHIFPGISVAEAFLDEKGNEVFFTGTKYGLEEKLIPGNGFRLVHIEARPFTGKSVLAKARTLLALVYGVVQAHGVIRKEKPDVILGMGGFTSVPMVLAGLQMGVPCFIHEQNVYPGMANRFLARKVKGTFISFTATQEYLKTKDVICTGNPVRKILRGKREAKRDNTFNIFVFGGSRGARSINDAVLALVPYLADYRNTVLYHQTGIEDFGRVKAGYGGCGTDHEVFPFTDEMEKYYNLADVVVSRAGASTIFELSYFGKAAIFVPYPFSAGAHQWKNAAHVEGIGGGHVIANSELSGKRLFTVLNGLRENREGLARMGENIRSIYVENAEEHVIRGIKARVS